MKKSLKVVLLILILLLTVSNFSMAADVPTFKLTSSKTDVKKGDEFNVVLSQESGYTIGGMQFDLVYDASLFELKAKAESDKWTINSSKDNHYEMIPKVAGIENGDIITYTFVALKDVKTGMIELKQIQVSDASVAQRDNINTISAQIGEEKQEIDDSTKNVITVNTNTNTNTNTNNNTTNTQNNNNTINNNKNNNTSNHQTTQQTTKATQADTTTSNSSTLPKTGNRTILIAVVAIGIVGVGFVSYAGYRKYKDI